MPKQIVIDVDGKVINCVNFGGDTEFDPPFELKPGQRCRHIFDEELCCKIDQDGDSYVKFDENGCAVVEVENVIDEVKAKYDADLLAIELNYNFRCTVLEHQLNKLMGN